MRPLGLGQRRCFPTAHAAAQKQCSLRRTRPTPCRASAARDLPEGSLGLPILGETLDLIAAGDTFGSSRRARYGNVYKTNILGAPTVMVYGEDAVRTVLAAEDKLVASDWPQVTSTLVGPDSLNLLSGQRHGTAKRALYEAFTERQIRRYVPRVAEVVQGNLERWASAPQPTQGYAACQELSQAVFDLVVLGGDGSRERARQLQDITARLQAGFQTPPVNLPFTDYGKAVAARYEFGQLVAAAIARIRTGDTAPGDGSRLECALADIVAAAAATSADSRAGAAALSDAVITDNAAAAFFGNASTGPSLAKALQYLAASPAVLARLVSEQQDVTSRHGTAITPDVLDEMPYGNAVAKELLRITPAVPAVFRVAIEDFELQGRTIPKGWRVWCHLGDSVLKYNKDVFDPDRWLQLSTAQPRSAATQQGAPPGMHVAATDPLVASSAAVSTADIGSGSSGGSRCPVQSGALAEYSLPFGAGIRACLGRNLVTTELLVLLALLTRGYEWEAVNPAEEWRVVPAPAPKEGLLVNLRRRK